jgi:hypothetical protein
MAFRKSDDHDVEKDGMRDSSYAEGGAVSGEMFVQGESLYAKVQRLAGRFHVEQRGIERVPENERYDNSLLNVGTMVRKSNPILDTTCYHFRWKAIRVPEATRRALLL